MHRLTLAAAFALALLAPSLSFAAPARPAAPPPPAPATFTIGDDTLIMPLPDGYCLPTPEQQIVADTLKASIQQSTLRLILFVCPDRATPGMPLRLVIVGTPKNLEGQTMARATTLDSLGTVTDTDWANVVNSEEGVLEGRYKPGSGAGPSIDATLRPVGRDDQGFYLAGQLKMSNGGEAGVVAMAEGVTVVKGHLVVVMAYSVEDGIPAVRAEAVVAKAATHALVQANDP